VADDQIEIDQLKTFFIAMFSSASKAALELRWGFALAFRMVFTKCHGFVW